MASSTSWVTRSTAGWCGRHSCTTRACIRIRVRASSAPNGSSSSSRSGWRTRARASDTRWASPPESVLGQSLSCPVSPTSARARGHGPRLRRPVESEDHVGEHAGPRQQPRLLVDDRPTLGHEHLALCARVEAGQRPQDGALARTAAAEQGHELARAGYRDRCREGPGDGRMSGAGRGPTHGGVARQSRRPSASDANRAHRPGCQRRTIRFEPRGRTRRSAIPRWRSTRGRPRSRWTGSTSGPGR